MKEKDIEEGGGGASGELSLEGSLTLQRIFNLKQSLMEALNKVDRLTINVSGAEEVDLSCLQLLCSAHRTAISLNKSLSLAEEQPEGFSHTLKEAGFIRHVGCSQDCRGSCIWQRMDFGETI